MNYLKTVYHLSIYMSLLACFSKCQHTTGRVESERNKEAREDSTKLATAYLGQSKIAFALRLTQSGKTLMRMLPTTLHSGETQPIPIKV
jgi:hypothetical protein